LANPNISLIFL